LIFKGYARHCWESHDLCWDLRLQVLSIQGPVPGTLIHPYFAMPCPVLLEEALFLVDSDQNSRLTLAIDSHLPGPPVTFLHPDPPWVRSTHAISTLATSSSLWVRMSSLPTSVDSYSCRFSPSFSSTHSPTFSTNPSSVSCP
jgi:hypothetical protein